MFGNFDWDVIRRSLPYLFRDGMTFTLTLTFLAMSGALVLGTLLAMMRLSSVKMLSSIAGGYVNLPACFCEIHRLGRLLAPT